MNDETKALTVLTPEEFLAELKKDPDLRKLGSYKVSGFVHFGNFVTQTNVHLGNGAFSEILLDDSRFSNLYLGHITAEKLFLNYSSITQGIYFGNSHIKSVYWGAARASKVVLYMIETDSMCFNNATIRDISFGQIKEGDVFLNSVRITTADCGSNEAIARMIMYYKLGISWLPG